MSQQIFFSVIIITKNEQNYLPNLLTSIQNQSFTDYELIVSDAKSTDNTRKIAHEYGAKVVEGGNIACGRNNGAVSSVGQYLIFLDADMILPSNCFTAIHKSITEQNTQLGSVFIQFNTHKLSLKIFYFISNWYFCLTQKIHPHGYGGIIFTSRKLHNEIKGFRDIVPFEDQDYILRANKISRSFRILTNPVVLTTSRRIEKDGYFYVIFRYLLITIFHFFHIGKKNMIKYDFDYDEK